MAGFFAKQLGKSREEYIGDYLPGFFPKPKEYTGDRGLNYFAIVQPPCPEAGLTINRILEIIQIDAPNDIEIKDWQGGKFITPSIPYICWLDRGDRYWGHNFRVLRQAFEEISSGGQFNWSRHNQARADFKNGQRLATISEGIASFLIDRSRVNQYNALSFLGSQVGDKRKTYLDLARRPEYEIIPRELIYEEMRGSRPIFVGRKIKLGNST